MAKTKPHHPAPEMPEPDPRWRQLTWDDLDAWAGARSVQRGRAYQRQDRVNDLAVSKDHRLLARVTGGARYVTSVWFRGEDEDDLEDRGDVLLRSTCTCPVGYDGCKHAVAVVAEYLDRLEKNADVPLADADDPRWATLQEAAADEDDEESSDDEESLDDDEVADKPARRSSGGAGRDWDEKVRQHIHAKSREELAELVCSLVERFPELRDEFRERIALGEGDVDRLVAQARKELQRVTSEEAWRSGWTGEGHLPDYNKIKHRLERLAEMGHADAVVRLGRELIERGIEQVGRSDDEGDTAAELSACLPVIFNALARSSLTPVKKLLFAIDVFLADDYDLIGHSADVVLNANQSVQDWSAVADELANRLSAKSPKSSKRRASDDDDDEDKDGAGAAFIRDYHRDQITSWLGRALQHAGRADELLAIYETEARRTNSYERLVRVLIEQGKEADALRWATEGIAKTVDRWPGIASHLAEQLCELARRNKQWDIIAAHAAHHFFQRPSPTGLNDLTAAAHQSQCAKVVQTFAMRFLEMDVSPIRLRQSRNGKTSIEVDPEWPLPVPQYLEPLVRERQPSYSRKGPHFDVLIELAIADKQPGDVLRWYDLWADQGKSSPHLFGRSGVAAYADRVAAAVVSSHPQRAAEIYRTQIDRLLPQASTSAYDSIATYLRKLRPVLKSVDRDAEWTQLIQQIRERYRNRPRFMEIIDRLDKKPILSNRRSSR